MSEADLQVINIDQRIDVNGISPQVAPEYGETSPTRLSLKVPENPANQLFQNSAHSSSFATQSTLTNYSTPSSQSSRHTDES